MRKIMKISFDFDGTLNDFFDGQNNPFKEKVRKIFKQLLKEGFDVCIITRRYDNDDENKVVFDVANELGLEKSKIHFTNREWKFKTINDLKVNYHLDDDWMDIHNIERYSPDTIGVHLENEKSLKNFYDLIHL